MGITATLRLKSKRHSITDRIEWVVILDQGTDPGDIGHAVAIGTRSGSKPEGNPAPTPIRTLLTPIRIPVQTIPPVIILHFAV